MSIVETVFKDKDGKNLTGTALFLETMDRISYVKDDRSQQDLVRIMKAVARGVATYILSQFVSLLGAVYHGYRAIQEMSKNGKEAKKEIFYALFDGAVAGVLFLVPGVAIAYSLANAVIPAKVLEGSRALHQQVTKLA